MTYALESQELEADILDVIHAWHKNGTGITDAAFNELALRILAHQLRYNIPYAKYCASFGVTESTLPPSWKHIPAVPTGAYKEATLATFNPARAALTFETSGTTRGTGGKHYMETSALYDAALLAAFDRLVLPETASTKDAPKYRYFNCVPSPIDRPQSSLGYMMAKIAAERGAGPPGWYVRGDEIDLDRFVTDVRAAIAEDAAIFIAGTAFAYVHLCDMLLQRNERLPLPLKSLVMETGGFKGRSRIVGREELYASMSELFHVPKGSILSEYGMTELTSQWYDRVPRDSAHDLQRIKGAPPWMRARVVGVDGKNLARGVVGTLIHVDLANRSSCIAIQTEDLGAEMDGGIVLLGREQGAALRGCSLDAEMLQVR